MGEQSLKVHLPVSASQDGGVETALFGEHGCHRATSIKSILDIVRGAVLQETARAAAELVAVNLKELFHADGAQCIEYIDTLPAATALQGGLAGYLAVSGGTLRIDHVETDRRYRPGTDDFEGCRTGHFLGTSIGDPSGRRLGILCVTRSANGDAFTDDDEALLKLLADYLPAAFLRFAAESAIERQSNQETMAGKAQDIYRPEAVAHACLTSRFGDIMRLSPTWINWVYWFVFMSVLGGLGGSYFVPVPRYASGPAMIEVDGATNDTSVVAFIPDKYRPELKAGMPIYFKLKRYGSVHQNITIDKVGAQAIEPVAARKFLTPADYDEIHFPERVVIVRASLSSDYFTLVGRRHRYHNGMRADVRIPVQSGRLLMSLVSSLTKSTNKDVD